MPAPRSLFGGLAVFVIVVAMIWLNYDLAQRPYRTDAVIFTWAATAGLMIAFMALIGVAVNRRPAGILIDERNRVSLSKLQAAAWTVLILSALAAFVAVRAGPDTKIAEVLAIHIPRDLLIAMGISVTSLVAAPAVLSLKSNAPPASKGELTRTAEKLKLDPGEIEADGQLFGRTVAAKAQWMDMFRGESVADAGAPDLSKVQQFLITVLLITIYTASLIDRFGNVASIRTVKTALPDLDPNFLWLMGISHVSYLAYKAAPALMARSGPAGGSDAVG